jgi:hypothetical protein
MGITDKPSAGEAPRNAQAQSSKIRTLVGIAAFLLATGSTLAVAPTATASTNNHIPSASGFAACGGRCPGFCPDPPSPVCGQFV